MRFFDWLFGLFGYYRGNKLIQVALSGPSGSAPRGVVPSAWEVTSLFDAAILDVEFNDFILSVINSRSLVVMCRPDHSGWVSRMIDAHPEVDIVYVGLQKNLETDLGDRLSAADIITPSYPVGSDEEVVLFFPKNQVFPKNQGTGLEEWSLIEADFTMGPYWAKNEVAANGAAVWRNPAGGMSPQSTSYTILDTRRVRDYSDLPVEVTGLYLELIKNKDDITQEGAWISPSGESHHCGYWKHDDYAELVLGKRSDELRHSGWIHVQKDIYAPPLNSNFGEMRVTHAQAKKLRKLGLKVYDEDIQYQ